MNKRTLEKRASDLSIKELEGLLEVKKVPDKEASKLTKSEIKKLIEIKKEAGEEEKKIDKLLSHTNTICSGINTIASNESVMSLLLGRYDNGKVRTLPDAISGKYQTDHTKKQKKKKKKKDRPRVYSSGIDDFYNIAENSAHKKKKKKKKKVKDVYKERSSAKIDLI